MPRTLHRRSGSPRETWAAMAGRMALAVLFGLGLLVPSLAGVTPAAAQATTVSFSTAEAAPADSIAYLVLTLDDESEQWRLADVLLDRAGLGEALDEEIGSELRDEAGEDLPLDAFLGGEVGIVVSPTVLETLAEESMGSADLEAMLGGMETASPEAESTEVGPQGFALALEARAPDTAWTGIRDSVLDEAQTRSVDVRRYRNSLRPTGDLRRRRDGDGARRRPDPDRHHAGGPASADRHRGRTNARDHDRAGVHRRPR